MFVEKVMNLMMIRMIRKNVSVYVVIILVSI